jgi:hypothetical protein
MLDSTLEVTTNLDPSTAPVIFIACFTESSAQIRAVSNAKPILPNNCIESRNQAMQTHKCRFNRLKHQPPSTHTDYRLYDTHYYINKRLLERLVYELTTIY